MINQETIQAVQQVALIEEVVGDFVSLKKRGQNLWACCPFHQERTPSFAVSPSKGFYKCFGCDAAGDSIAFIKAIEGISFVEAVKHLAQKYNIPIQETEEEHRDITAQHEKDSLYILMKLANNYYIENLWHHSEGQRIGHAYLEERGITNDFIKQFELGYSLDSWQGFHSYACKQGYKDDLLEKAGLIVHNQEKLYDRFRGRVIFPIHNLSGKVIAFAARILKSEDNQPKYINSPETPIYHKSDVLYGIYQAKQKIKQVDKCFLVEGYTDVISLHMAGIENVVASSGTSLTDAQIQLISRFTKHITVLFDGDTAGIKAALRGIDKILEKGLHVKVILLPPGEDPDSYSKKLDNLAFQTYLQEHEQDFITFKAKLLMKGVGEDPVQKAEVIREILQSIALIPDEVSKSLFLQQCSRLLDINEGILLGEHNKILLKKEKGYSRPHKLVHNSVNELQLTAKRGELMPLNWAATIEAYEQESIRLLLNYGSIILEDGNPLSTYLLQELADVPFQHPVYKQILTTYERLALQGQAVDVNFFVQHTDERIQKTSIDLTASPYEVSDKWQEKYQIHISTEEDNLYKNAYKNILRLKLRLIHQLIEENNKLLKDTLHKPEEEDKLLQVYAALKQSETAIAQQLGMVIIG
jgi:DNA primase